MIENLQIRKKANSKSGKITKVVFPSNNPIFFEDDKFVYGIHNRLIYIMDVKNETISKVI